MIKTPELEKANLGDKFIEIVSRYHDIPYQSLKAASYVILSQTLGKHILIENTPLPFPRPNVFFMIGSDPAITRRSTLFNLVEQVIKQTWQIVEKVDEEDDRENTEALWLNHKFEGANVEGFADNVERTRQDSYILMSGEFGFLLRQASDPRSYSFGLISLLSKLYYGESHQFNLSQRGGKKGMRYIPPGLFLNQFVAMQRLDLYLSPTLLEQGYLRRNFLVPIYTRDLDPENYKPVLDNNRQNEANELAEYASQLAQREGFLIEHSKLEFGKQKLLLICPRNQEVRDAIVNIDKEIYQGTIREANENSDHRTNPWTAYRESNWEFVTKFSTLEALASSEPMFEMSHVERALKYIKLMEPSQKEAIAAIFKQTLEKRPMVLQDPTALVTNVLSRIYQEYDGYFKWRTIQDILDSTDTKQVAGIIQLLKSKEFAEVKLTESSERDQAKSILPESVFNKLITAKGRVPEIYELTEKAKAYLNGNGL